MSAVTLSVEDAVAQISAQTRLTAQDVRDLLACTPEQLAILLQDYKDSNAMPTASAWDIVLKILGMCVQVAGIITPLVGAISAVYGLGKTIAG